MISFVNFMQLYLEPFSANCEFHWSFVHKQQAFGYHDSSIPFAKN